MIRIDAIPGQKIEVPLTADAGFPVDIQIGHDRGPAYVEKRRGQARRGRPGEVEVSAWRWCPPLGAGTHRVVVHDTRGAHDAGTVTIGRA